MNAKRGNTWPFEQILQQLPAANQQTIFSFKVKPLLSQISNIQLKSSNQHHPRHTAAIEFDLFLSLPMNYDQIRVNGKYVPSTHELRKEYA